MLLILIKILFWFFICYGLTIAFILPKLKKLISQSKGEFKVYLDDERQTPDGWTRVYNYEGCIDLLKRHKVTHLSLDHDLGDDKSGYDVVKWIEEKCYNNPKYNPPIMTVHSANPAGRQNIERAIKSIEKIISKR